MKERTVKKTIPIGLIVVIIVASAVFNHFKSNSDKSIISRVLEIPTLTDIKVADFLTADNVLMIQMTSDVVDMVVGMQPTTVQWETQGGFLLNFKVMAIMIPRLKNTDAGRSGIVHLF